MKKLVLFISGIADNNNAKIISIVKNTEAVYDPGGNSNLNAFISDELKYFHIVFDKNRSQKVDLLNPSIIFNQISDPDTHKIALSKVTNLDTHFQNRVKILNHPINILKTTREQVYENLKDIKKVVIPKTIKFKVNSPKDVYNAIKENKFEFPVIFRKAGDHGGISTILIENFESDELFYPFALDGDDFYLTQFVDYSQKEVFRKYRLVVIDGEVFIRHCILSDKWMIHAQSKNPEYLNDEIKYLKEFNSKIKKIIQPTISEIHKTIGLDYFGIDCDIDKDANILIYELNANMNILVGGSKNTLKYIDKIKKKILKMINSHTD